MTGISKTSVYAELRSYLRKYGMNFNHLHELIITGQDIDDLSLDAQEEVKKIMKDIIRRKKEKGQSCNCSYVPYSACYND